MRYIEPKPLVTEQAAPLPYLEPEDELAGPEGSVSTAKSEAAEATDAELVRVERSTALQAAEAETEKSPGLIERVRRFLKDVSDSPIAIFNLTALPVAGLALFLGIVVLPGVAEGTVASGAEPAIGQAAETLNRSAQGLPGDTELFGSFQDSGTVSFIDPDSEQLQRSELIESQVGYLIEPQDGYSYEISGTVDDYSIELSFERDSKTHQLTYDSTTGKTTEKELN